MRYQHFLWKSLRENWLDLDVSTQKAITKLGWAPPRPSAFKKLNGDQIVLADNFAGEDFLFNYRQMLAKVNQLVAGTAYSKVTGWTRCPPPSDPKWSVPPAYDVSGNSALTTSIANIKSDAFYWDVIVPAEEELTDPDTLRTMTLGQLGSKLEFGLHKYMLLRFSELTAIGIRDSGSNPIPDIDESWDDLSYRWLGDAYSAHVNPAFWKIQGWLDNYIELWRKANGIETIKWKGTWQSGPMNVLEDLIAAGSINDDFDVEFGSTGNW